MLIDDRTERQIKFYEETGVNLDEYSDVLDNLLLILMKNYLKTLKVMTSQ